ncbi:hypothetical protein GCM10009678_72280 [Actinomadura kijaniata]|uniref:Uncharacterized protein n=1 Tax=Actinomadura namibiensis TaxID=182080 RepID=A0A7W3LYK2_ACTNM|nr:DUF6519 domain-containing protein [Actinomadura namibiensis]MBA8956588.1 hypothetical protein [Actinomadura namibiensis]
MHGDFTRLRFDPGHRSVLLQQGRVLLDADFNEQSEITAYQDESRARDMIGRCGAPATGAGFAIVDAAGAKPANTPWAQLHIAPGRYYVDGIMVEAPTPAASAAGWPLAAQPHLPAIEDETPGLDEPAVDGRYAVYLDVWHHHVTADQEPALHEPALGSPDTSTRLRTVWQVRIVPLTANEKCSDLHRDGWLAEPPPSLTASLQQPEAQPDPCRLSASGGYQRLENQLYRVQIHDTPEAGFRFLWSRENGSVVAAITAITNGGTELVLDRTGRDEELSIRPGDVVEVTSDDWALHQRPGRLATAGAPQDLVLPVTWEGQQALTLKELGRAPIVRRWEGAARPATGSVELEAGIQVQFGASGTFQTGQYWLIPARTVRLVYGLSGASGSIDWPKGSSGESLALPPHGPVHHRTPLAILVRSGGATPVWTLESDCRCLYPTLTDLTTFDLLGGDGQEVLRGLPLPEPVIVCVRRGGLPVTDARVRFETRSGGVLAVGEPPDSGPNRLDLGVGGDGTVAVRWRPDPAGPVAQVLTAQLLDDKDRVVGPAARVTGRVNQATLRLLGGDGQLAAGRNKVLPEPVRVVVDTPHGPVAGVKLIAGAPAGAPPAELAGTFAKAVVPNETRPDTLGMSTSGVTGPDGSLGFWWQSAFTIPGDSAALEVRFADAAVTAAPVRVTAQLSPAVGARPVNVHIEKILWKTINPNTNEKTELEVGLESGSVSYQQLVKGFEVTLDEMITAPEDSVRVLLRMMWPARERRFGYTWLELHSTVEISGKVISWNVFGGETGGWVGPWLKTGLWTHFGDDSLSVIDRLDCRLVIDGWAIRSAAAPERSLNCYSQLIGGKHRFPRDDATFANQFVFPFKLDNPNAFF